MDKMYFPMFVDISGKNAVVVGGGNVGARRAETLLHFTDSVTVIAPVLSPRLLQLEREGRLCCICRAFEPGDIRGGDIVLAATDCRELNRSIGEVCRREAAEQGRSILFNTADDKALCDFYFPSVIETDGVIIGMNSAGKNPSKVRRLRERLMKEFV